MAKIKKLQKFSEVAFDLSVSVMLDGDGSGDVIVLIPHAVSIQEIHIFLNKVCSFPEHASLSTRVTVKGCSYIPHIVLWIQHSNLKPEYR